MSNVSATATIVSNINYTLVDIGSTVFNESAGLSSSSKNLTDGTGALNINYGVISSGNIPSGGKSYFDFRALEKKVFDLNTTVQFNQIKSIIFENRETSSGINYTIYATGSLALTDLFNGGSGNLILRPRATHIYSDITGGVVVDGTNREVVLDDVDGSGAAFTMLVVGTTG